MRLLVADDHDLVRESIGAILSRAEFAQVKLAASLEEAIEIVSESERFDVIFLDYDMPGMNGLEGLRQMIEAAKGGAVALMSGVASQDIAKRALQVGAAGFIPKTLSTQSLIRAASFMAEGEVFAPTDFMIAEPSEHHNNLLSKRETEVLRGICEGKSNKEIARDLDLQEVTVKLHVKTLSRKLDARNRTHAAMIARDRALLH